MQVRRLGRHWAVEHYYVFIIVAGFVIYFLAGPFSSLFQLSKEEYALASESDSRVLEYKGKNFLEWRYDWLGVVFGMWLLALAVVLVGVGLDVFQLYKNRAV